MAEFGDLMLLLSLLAGVAFMHLAVSSIKESEHVGNHGFHNGAYRSRHGRFYSCGAAVAEERPRVMTPKIETRQIVTIATAAKQLKISRQATWEAVANDRLKTVVSTASLSLH